MAKIAQCTDRTIRRHSANIKCFDSTTASRNRSGRRSLITSLMLTALCDHLVEKPDEDLDGMVLFLLDEFGELRSRWSIRRALASANWTPKTIQRIAKGRDADLRDYHEHIVSEFPSWTRVYVDESGVDRKNWVPSTWMVSTWCNTREDCTISTRTDVAYSTCIRPRWFCSRTDLPGIH